MTTGFEGYLIGGVVIALIALRLAGRHVTVNNNNSPTANAESTSGGGTASKSSRSVIGVVAMITIAVIVAALVVLQIGARAAPVTQSVSVPQVESTKVIPIVPEPVSVYVPTELPRYQSAIDFTPIAALALVCAAMGVILWAVSRKPRNTAPPASQPKQITRVKRVEGLTHPAFDAALKNSEKVR